MELQAAVLVILGVALLATPAVAYPSGAPPQTCDNLTPGHGTVSTTAVPYTISVDKTTYNGGTTIKVTVSGGIFRGILMQVRQVGSTTKHGTWSELPANTKITKCDNADNSVTHANTNEKQNVTFTWTAPEGVTDDLQVRATVAQVKEVWWMDLTSDTLTHDPDLTTVSPSTTPSVSSHVGPAAGSLFLAILTAVFFVKFY